MPDCGFPVNYTLSLVPKNYASSTETPFSIDYKGVTSDPEFVFFNITELDPAVELEEGAEAGILHFEPLTEESTGKTWAVYIYGEVIANKTVNVFPVTAVNNFFDVTVPLINTQVVNTAPFLAKHAKLMLAVANTTNDYVLGIPWDMQLNEFEIKEWGIKDLAEIPDWITLKQTVLNVTGIVFTVTPPPEELDSRFEIFVTLEEINIEEPLTVIYRTKLSVIKSAEDAIAVQ